MRYVSCCCRLPQSQTTLPKIETFMGHSVASIDIKLRCCFFARTTRERVGKREILRANKFMSLYSRTREKEKCFELTVVMSLLFQKIERPFLAAVASTLGDRYTDNVEGIYKITIKFIIETLIEGYDAGLKKQNHLGNSKNITSSSNNTNGANSTTINGDSSCNSTTKPTTDSWA